MITSGDQATAAGSRPIRPSRRWYWLAGGVLAVALICIALGVAGFFSLNRQIKDFQRVTVPGGAEVTFAQPGRYILYLERPGQCCSFSAGSGDSVPFPSWSMNGELAPADGGPPVSVSSWRGATDSYGVAGHEGQTAMYFTIGQPGGYILQVKNVVPGSITDVAVGRGIGHGVVWLLLILAALLALIPAGLVIGGITFFRRRRARRNPLQAPQVMHAPAVIQPAESSRSAMSTPGPIQPYPIQPYSNQPAARLPYLQGGPVGFGEAVKKGLSNGFFYRGRASRSAYWWFYLFALIVVFVVEALTFIPLTMNSSGGSVVLLFIGGIVSIYLGLVLLALLVRRLHDIGKSGWWVFIGFVPIAGPIVLLVFTVLEGTAELDRYQL
jgi:uncharacterized membrane protein YhaH (DUF805 family)